MVSIGDTNYSLIKLGWKTVDIVDADYLCDIRKDPLPFQSCSVDAINSSHVVEHLEPQAARNFYAECYRALKPGGVLRISTPDADLLIDKYMQGDWHFFVRADGQYIFSRIYAGDIPPESLLLHNRLVGWFASYSGRVDTGGGPIVSKLEVDGRLASGDVRDFSDWCVSLLEDGRTYAHVNVYESTRLYKELREAGFTEIIPSGYGSSDHALLVSSRIDKEKHKSYSLYVDAMKEVH
jgi:SAM-dependent methyltransferase